MFLGTIHREVGAAQEMLRRVVGFRGERDADARRREDLRLADRHRIAQRNLQPLGDARGVARFLYLLEEERELVTAESSEGVDGAKTACQTTRDFDE